MASIRDQRYCEVDLIYRGGEVEVYNTFGVNDCPAQCWDGLTPSEIVRLMREEGKSDVIAAVLNGPRYWTIDAVEAGSEPPEPTRIGCFSGRLVASIPLEGAPPPVYTEQAINRTTTYTFLAHTQMFFLTNPQGERYIMQSYSQQVDPSLTLAQLPSIGDILQLPDGWKYQVGSCDRDLTVSTIGNQAIILQDNLENTYQKLDTSQTNFNPEVCLASSPQERISRVESVLLPLEREFQLDIDVSAADNGGRRSSTGPQTSVWLTGAAIVLILIAMFIVLIWLFWLFSPGAFLSTAPRGPPDLVDAVGIYAYHYANGSMPVL